MMNFARIGGKSVAKVSKAAFNGPSFKGMATVAENTIKITFVDAEGNRATVPARVGKTLLEVAQMHKVDIEGSCEGGGGPTDVKRTEHWTETTYGEGPICMFCHVQIPSKYHHLLPRVTDHEIKGLKDTWEDEAISTSRLACMITLEHKHDGMVVFVPDPPPVDII